jgi:carbon-monoxide dehydrogenase small subunit
VLLDGRQVCACLVPLAQLEGREVRTVEGLAKVGALSPLQRSFLRHGAAQCGICTPGMLMAATDLLARNASPSVAEVQDALGGVLCRCTGYRNIVAAVSDVAHAHREGIPAAGNCGKHALMGYSGGTPGGEGEQEAAAKQEVPLEIQLPQGDPTFAVEVAHDVEVSLAQVWRVLDDIDLMPSCLPGAEITEHVGGDRYAGRAKVAVGPIRLSFAGQAHVIERDPAMHLLRVIGQGQEAGGGRTQADIKLRAEHVGDRVRLRADADVYLTGRIAQFGRALAGDVSKRIFERFATALEEAAISGAAPTTKRKPPSAMGLMAGTLVAKVRESVRKLGRRLRRRRSPR